MGNNYFVTGANGWIGLEVIKKLLCNGDNVKALVRTKSLELDELSVNFEKLSIIYGDLRNISLWEHHLNGIDKLIHLGAKVHSYVKTYKDAEDFTLINYIATKKLFIKAENVGISDFVFVSSVAVEDMNEKEVNLLENAYAKSKKEAEDFLIKSSKRSKIKISIVRPVTLYGGNDKGNFKRLYKLSRKNIFPIIGDGKNMKSVIYYKDFASALINVSKSSQSITGNVITIGTEQISIQEILDKYKKNRNVIIKIRISSKYLLKFAYLLKKINKKKSLKLIKQINTLSRSNMYCLEKGKVFLPKKLTYFNHVDFEKEYLM